MWVVGLAVLVDRFLGSKIETVRVYWFMLNDSNKALLESVYNVRWLRYARFSYHSSGICRKPDMKNSQPLRSTILYKALKRVSDFLDRH